jgi:hypothetical protein
VEWESCIYKFTLKESADNLVSNVLRVSQESTIEKLSLKGKVLTICIRSKLVVLDNMPESSDI